MTFTTKRESMRRMWLAQTLFDIKNLSFKEFNLDILLSEPNEKKLINEINYRKF